MLTYIIHDANSKRDISDLLALPQPRVLEAIVVHGNPSLGCALSHQLAIQKAVDQHADYVWVLEDDCRMLPPFTMERWLACVDALVLADCDVLNGGVLRLAGAGQLLGAPRASKPVKHCAIDGLTLMEGGQYWSSHCVVYAKRAFDAMLAPMARTAEYGDVGVPIDLRPGAQGLRTLVTVPFVADQHAGVSAVGRGYFDYGHDFALASDYLERIEQFANFADYCQALTGAQREKMIVHMDDMLKQHGTVVLKEAVKVMINGVRITIPAGVSRVTDQVATLLRECNITEQ